MATLTGSSQSTAADGNLWSPVPAETDRPGSGGTLVRVEFASTLAACGCDRNPLRAIVADDDRNIAARCASEERMTGDKRGRIRT